MDDQQRAQIIEIQRQSMGYGTVLYERGMDLVEKTGWIGTRDMARSANLFAGVAGGGAVTVLVIEDVNTPILDQNCFEVPFHRVVEMNFAPQIP